MRKALRLTAALLATLALPALAQTPSTTGTTRTTPPTTSALAPTPNTTHSSTTRPTATTPSTTTPAASSARTAPAPAADAATNAAASAGAARPVSTGGRIDINSATEQQLDALPGIGPARAKAIIAGRPWDDLNDLVKKNALPQSVFDSLKPRLALANINTSTAADLAKTLPGIGDVRSRNIVNGRPYAQPQDLVTKGALTQNQFDKIKDLIAF